MEEDGEKQQSYAFWIKVQESSHVQQWRSASSYVTEGEENFREKMR